MTCGADRFDSEFKQRFVITRSDPERSEAESRDCDEAISNAHSGIASPRVVRGARNDVWSGPI